ncbi:nuclear transport factor 2 family protein [Actinoplanes sp. NPDC051475]|uniref:nuclear transport factor 2 family protein n=1 Tax=Actinoplanes sp. NPDC051475 TaxID=3157225 RepID=UPI00344C92EC
MTTPAPTAVRGTADTIAAFFDRFGAGDAEGMLAAFADRVDFDVPGAQIVPWTGKRGTPAEIAGFVRSAMEDIRTQRFAIEKTIVDGADGIVLGELAHEVIATGKIFEGRFALRITVEQGRITRYTMFENSYAAAQAFTP